MIIKQHPYYPFLVSNEGKIWTLDDEEIKVKLSYRSGHIPVAVISVPQLKRLSKDGKNTMPYTILVKKLVAETFLKVPDCKYMIFVKDGNELNCHASNLEIRPVKDVVMPNIKKCHVKNSKRVKIDDVEYPSIRDAAIALAPVLHYTVNTISGYISRTINDTQLPGDKRFAAEHKIELCDT